MAKRKADWDWDSELECDWFHSPRLSVGLAEAAEIMELPEPWVVKVANAAGADEEDPLWDDECRRVPFGLECGTLEDGRTLVLLREDVEAIAAHLRSIRSTEEGRALIRRAVAKFIEQTEDTGRLVGQPKAVQLRPWHEPGDGPLFTFERLLDEDLRTLDKAAEILDVSKQRVLEFIKADRLRGRKIRLEGRDRLEWVVEVSSLLDFLANRLGGTA